MRLCSRCLLHGASFLLPVAFAVLVTAILLAPLRVDRIDVALDKMRISRTADLERRYLLEDYSWPLQGNAPRLALSRLPRDLDTQDVEARKALFFRLVLPLVLAENERIARQRDALQATFALGQLIPGTDPYRFASQLARSYRVQGNLNSPATRELLLQRVDTIPPALALAQAANESAWGTSRFAREGNSLFGQWTWTRDAGLVPLRRVPGKGHLVRSFPNLREGVRAYMHNLNTGHAYGYLRHLRARMRSAGQPLDPLALSGGLGRYSERGDTYVEEIRAMMRANDLLALDPLVGLR